MKIIDLLNIWVNDRAKLPKKIKVDDKIFEYREFGNLYVTSNEIYFLITDYLDCIEKLNNEVEVIEENKGIEELEISESNTEIIDDFVIKNREKINELVRAVNKINKEREEK